MRSYRLHFMFLGMAVLLALGAGAVAALHISPNHDPDPASLMYEEVNKAFEKHWRGRSGVSVIVNQAQSESGTPISAVLDGLDVVTLALSYDAEAMKKSTRFTFPYLLELPKNSPYSSTVVFLVRRDNPKQLTDWQDLVQPDVEVVTPAPKTSKDGRWNYLAAWGYASKQGDGSDSKAFEFVSKLFANVKRMNLASGDARTAFVDQGVGDVLLIWENEANLILKKKGGDRFEIIVPSMSIEAEPSVSVVDNMRDKDGMREVSKAYFAYLYTSKVQEIAARHYYRPRNREMAAKYRSELPPLSLFTVDEAFGGWKEAENKHFAYGGVFDQLKTNSIE